MSPDEMRERAVELFSKRLHCSQVLAIVGMEKLGIQAPEVIKALGAFGGGIGGTGNICGALVGATSVIGTLYSRGSLEEKENPRMWHATKLALKNFQELTQEHGGINCSQIARVDWMDREQVKTFYFDETSRRRHCMEVVGETAKSLGELLDNELQRIAAKNAER